MSRGETKDHGLVDPENLPREFDDYYVKINSGKNFLFYLQRAALVLGGLGVVGAIVYLASQ